MKFRKKLKIRLYIAIALAVAGIATLAAALITKSENQFISAYGLALTVIGAARIKQYFFITKNEETVKKREIAESDERNVHIAHKARSMTFYVYILASSVGVIALQLINMPEAAAWLSYPVCALVLIYWICYLFYSKIS